MALSNFFDAGEVFHWATEAVNRAIANGNKLHPSATVTRAEVVAILMRFVTVVQ